MKSFEYFWLKPDAALSNPIKIFHFAVEGPVTTGMVIDPKKVPKHQVAYFEYSPQLEICDVLFQPTLLIENKIKRLWGLYESQMKFKSVQVFANDPEIDVSPLYWSPMLKSVDCMDQATTFYSNGMLENLVVRLRSVQAHQIFQVAGPVENVILVSLPVAESMLRRFTTGYDLVPVNLV